MAKLGVGVGDDFPMEEKSPQATETVGNAPGETRRYWREQRTGWREQGRHAGQPYRHHPSARRIVPALIAIGGIALLIAIISHFFYFILGAAVLAVLFYLYRDPHGGTWEMPSRTPSSPEAQ